MMDGSPAPPLVVRPSGPRHHMTTRADSRLHRLRRAAASVGVLGIAALFMVSLAVPLQAPLANAGQSAVDAAPVAFEAQELEVAEQAETTEIARGEYGVTSYAETLRKRYAGLSYASVGAAWTGPVRWPFPNVVRMTAGFGPRDAPCRGCSTMHRGIDLLPGAGTPIFAVADGVVSAQQEGWSYGDHVFIDHVIDGQQVTSLYAHMRSGSSPLRPGDTVRVGDFVGLVGSTGAVTAPHLHLEIRVDGTAIDPVPWLYLHTGR